MFVVERPARPHAQKHSVMALSSALTAAAPIFSPAYGKALAGGKDVVGNAVLYSDRKREAKG